MLHKQISKIKNLIYKETNKLLYLNENYEEYIISEFICWPRRRKVDRSRLYIFKAQDGRNRFRTGHRICEGQSLARRSVRSSALSALCYGQAVP